MKVSVVSAAATLLTSLAIVPVPPLLLKITVWFGRAVHCAYSVTSAVNGYERASAYEVPVPFAEVFQPEKVIARHG